MDRETLKNILLQKNYPLDKVDTLLDEADKYDLYKELKANEIKSVGQVIAKVKEKQQEQARQANEETMIKQRREEIAAHIKKEMLPHVRTAIGTSNKPLQEKENYEFPCAIKAFCIEYMLKSIYVMTKAQEAYTDIKKAHSTIDEIVKVFIASAKRELPPPKHYSGHEIYDILNKLMAPHLKTTIEYEAILNHMDPNVKEHGSFVEPYKEGSSLENFVIDYILMTKDFSQLESQSLEEIASNRNFGYEKNNKAFMTLRYLDEKATKDDYELLNCLMISTYMTLSLLLAAPQLADNFSDKENIPYEAVKDFLTEEEYNHLITTSNSKKFDTNALITYQALLKHYLKDKMPRLTDERYTRINDLLSAVNSASNKSTQNEIFPTLAKKTDINLLERSELKELLAFAPEFIYNCLDYNNKLIFELCQDKGVDFELYYGLDPENFKFLITSYGELFKGQSIAVELLKREPQELASVFEIIKRRGIEGNIPAYYFNYSAKEIEEAHQIADNQNEILSQEDISLSSVIHRIVSHFHLDQCNSEENEKQIKMIIESLTFFICAIEGIRRELIARDKSFNLKVSEDIKKGIITGSNCEEYHLTAENFTNIGLMLGLMNKFKTDTIEPFMGMKPIELMQQNGNLIIYSANEGAQSFDIVKNNPSQVISQAFFQPTVFEENPTLRTLMDKGMPVNANMCFLKEFEVAKNYGQICDLYASLNQEGIDIGPRQDVGDYLFYKKPEEVKEITEMYRQYATATDQEELIPFKGELLYFDLDTLQDNFADILEKIEDKHCYDEEFTYKHAQALTSKKYRKKKVEKTNENSPTSFYVETPQEEPVEEKVSTMPTLSTSSIYDPFVGPQTILPGDIIPAPDYTAKEQELEKELKEIMNDLAATSIPIYMNAGKANHQRRNLH